MGPVGFIDLHVVRRGRCLPRPSPGGLKRRMTKTAREWDGGLMGLSNFELASRSVCKQLIGSGLRVRWSSQSQNNRLQCTVPLDRLRLRTTNSATDKKTQLQCTVPLGPIETPLIVACSGLGLRCNVRSLWDRLRH